MTLSSLAGFVVAVALAAMAPGPTTALVVRRGALGGVRAAAPVIAGMQAGLSAWALASALGLAALVAASEVAFLVLRIVGAVVLVFLGVQAWRASREASGGLATGEEGERPGWWRAAGSGLLTNLTNPKVAVFAFAFYPQFIAPGADVLGTTAALALLHIVVDSTWFLLVAAFVGRARAFFGRVSVRRHLERLTGTVLIALGLRLAVLHQ
ncbi:LysE family translocator [Streptoalloteichus tenebrarius]|uniref:LysE family translocator n=1 Tax=Streptoalloteichus tenebrarius (strain ATCC 17920 / DSM 40477 / JCM 4838 / CBS 697.72 / NBRC 16177 / NCIMB 11028 / NRRL B-12390 / A12253. 1 / ISP 5477) TaxID=1933 RepID=UPI0020A5D466|nr:LysE family translocator [Streptoalloteichus tenebrarius]